MYRIIGADGREYGPVEAVVLRQWIQQGRLNARSRVLAPDAADWKTLGDLPEFHADLQAANPPALPPAAPAGQETALAVTSLVLGILAVACFGPLTGLPAVITGHMARSRARKSPAVYGGEGLALGGLITGYIGLAVSGVAIMAALLLPALAKAKERAQTIQCVNQMKSIGLALRMYASDHGDAFPPNLASASNELSTAKILICPADRQRVPPADWSSATAENISYEYTRPEAGGERPGEVMLLCPIHKTIGLADGGVHLSSASGKR
jgi:type II secretory pathway pseudopilin PulG